MAIPNRDQLGGTAFARAWARLGYPVFPLSSATNADGKWAKRPTLCKPEDGGPVPPDEIAGLDRGKGGFHGASCDDGYVHRTWADLRGASLTASPLPVDVIALDFDRPESEWLKGHPDLVEIYQRQRAATFVVQDAGRRAVSRLFQGAERHPRPGPIPRPRPCAA